MKLIKHIIPTQYDVSRLKNMFDSNALFVDNSFQRRYVWEEKHKVALIETILLGYDIPAIYIWQQEPNPMTGEIRYSIVDGQQRTGAIVSFLNNEFPLTKKYLISKADAVWENMFFIDLPDNLKRDIWSYSLRTMEIDRDVPLEEIKTMFLRLNITNKALNPQELRNAQFNGKFIRLAIEISELNFWRKNSIFSNNDIRRMKDVEFVSHLLIFLRKGMKTATSQTTINNIYDLYNDEYPEAKQDYDICKSILSFIQKIIDEVGVDIASKINKITHIYTLFVATYAFMLENYYGKSDNMIIKTVCNFYRDYFSERQENQHIKLYMLFSKDAVTSVNSRLGRYNSLLNYVKENMDK